MKIIKNTSHYDTKKLKSMFCFIHSQLAKHEGKLSWWSELDIKIQHRQHCRSGRAFLRKTYHKDWDMFLVTDISYLFDQKKMLNADLSNWDVSHVTNMHRCMYLLIFNLLSFFFFVSFLSTIIRVHTYNNR